MPIPGDRSDQMKPYNAVSIAGMEFFVVSSVRGPDGERSKGVLRISGTELTGKAAFHKAQKAMATPDPLELAHLAMLFLDNNVAGSRPWSKEITGSVPREELALANEPSISNGVLEYWRRHEQMAGLVRCRVTLESATIECKAGAQIVYDKDMATNPMATIERDLARGDISSIRRGVAELKKLGTAEAVAKLTDLALNHNFYRARAEATKALGQFGHPGQSEKGSKTLSRILLFDGHAEVRKQAAIALGLLGEPSAREALEKAAAGDADGNVRGFALLALKKLRK